MTEQRWIHTIIGLFGSTLIVYLVFQNWLFAMSFSGSCTGDENYGIPLVVYETSLIGGLLVCLLLTCNLSLILMMVKQRIRYFIFLACAVFTNIIISFELKDANVGSMVFDFVEVLRGSMSWDRFWWNLPHTFTILAGTVSAIGTFSLICCWLWTGRRLFKLDKTFSVSKEQV